MHSYVHTRCQIHWAGLGRYKNLNPSGVGMGLKLEIALKIAEKCVIFCLYPRAQAREAPDGLRFLLRSRFYVFQPSGSASSFQRFQMIILSFRNARRALTAHFLFENRPMVDFAKRKRHVNLKNPRDSAKRARDARDNARDNPRDSVKMAT